VFAICVFEGCPTICEMQYCATMSLTVEQIRQLVGETLITENTVRRWADGGKVTPANNRALLRAAAQLGFGADNEDHEPEKAVP